MNEELMEFTTPVTIERISAIFEQQGWAYRLEDNSLHASFAEKPFIFTYDVKSSRLEMRSLLPEILPESAENEILNFVEEWHRAKMFPKAYLGNTADNYRMLQLEQTISFVSLNDQHLGATDMQLAENLHYFIEAALFFYEEFVEFFSVDGAL